MLYGNIKPHVWKKYGGIRNKGCRSRPSGIGETQFIRSQAQSVRMLPEFMFLCAYTLDSDCVVKHGLAHDLEDDRYFGDEFDKNW
jgi:hypothetical protein